VRFETAEEVVRGVEALEPRLGAVGERVNAEGRRGAGMRLRVSVLFIPSNLAAFGAGTPLIIGAEGDLCGRGGTSLPETSDPAECPMTACFEESDMVVAVFIADDIGDSVWTWEKSI